MHIHEPNKEVYLDRGSKARLNTTTKAFNVLAEVAFEDALARAEMTFLITSGASRPSLVYITENTVCRKHSMSKATVENKY